MKNGYICYKLKLLIWLFCVVVLWISDSENFSYLIRKSSSSAKIEGDNYVSLLQMGAGADTMPNGELRLYRMAGNNRAWFEDGKLQCFLLWQMLDYTFYGSTEKYSFSSMIFARTLFNFKLFLGFSILKIRLGYLGLFILVDFLEREDSFSDGAWIRILGICLLKDLG